MVDQKFTKLNEIIEMNKFKNSFFMAIRVERIEKRAQQHLMYAQQDYQKC